MLEELPRKQRPGGPLPCIEGHKLLRVHTEVSGAPSNIFLLLLCNGQMLIRLCDLHIRRMCESHSDNNQTINATTADNLGVVLNNQMTTVDLTTVILRSLKLNWLLSLIASCATTNLR